MCSVVTLWMGQCSKAGISLFLFPSLHSHPPTTTPHDWREPDLLLDEYCHKHLKGNASPLSLQEKGQPAAEAAHIRLLLTWTKADTQALWAWSLCLGDCYCTCLLSLRGGRFLFFLSQFCASSKRTKELAWCFCVGNNQTRLDNEGPKQSFYSE